MLRTNDVIHRTARSTMAGVFAVALVCGSTLAVTMLAGSSGAASVARVPACTTGGLVEWMNTQGNGAAGTIYYTLQFTNLSGHACTLRGYPGVSGVNLGGMQLGRAAARSSTTPVKTITIGQGKTARATLGITDVGALSPSQCHPTTAAGLRIYAPNQTTPKLIPFPFNACAKAGVNYLTVQAVR